MRVAYVTFGCRLNRAEALEEEAACAAAGHDVVDLDPAAPPDRIVVRGCSVTAKAQRACEKAITRLRRLYPAAEIRLAGCLEAARNAAPASRVSRLAPDAHRQTRDAGRTSRAYLKVQDGCSGRCAFCIVPHFRGPPVSVPFVDVLARARAFLAAGYREIVVTGCNLALYRAGGRGLADLLAALAELPSPGHRVRLGSLEPGLCDAPLLEAFAAHANICRFLHLSLQSGSDAVLARMNRPYAIETVAAFCAEAARRLGPRLALGADALVGFPGETEEDFARTRAFLAGECFAHPPFSNIHVFPYSERPGTPAATLDGSVPHAVRLARARALERQAKAQRLRFAEAFVGADVEVCVEKGGDHGWTAEYLPCRLAAVAPRRALVSVRIGARADATLIAQTR